MNRSRDILSEASSDPSVLRSLKQGPRFFKMLFAAIYHLDPKFTIFGHEPDIAVAVTKYLGKTADDTTTEGIEWGRTLRTGRMDTDDIAVSVATLANYIVNQARLQPNDSDRFFNRQLRKQIIELSGFRCENILDDGQRCEATLSNINFHADHVVPHSQGGPTTLANGQALCASCNSRKGASQSYLSTD